MAEQQMVDDTEETTDDITSLTDVFEDSEEEAEPEKEAETKDDKGEVEAKADTEEPEKEPEKAPEKEKVETLSTESIGLQAALVAERQKRQAVEAELKRLEEPEKVPDPIEDPEGYSKHIAEKSTKGLLDTKISLSRSMMFSFKDDYREKETVFMNLVGKVVDGEYIITNELLFNKFQSSDNPGLFAYDHAVDHLLAEKYKDPDFEKNLEARLTEKILAGLKEGNNEDKDESLSATEVPDLTKATASGSNTEPIEKDYGGIKDIFDDD